MTDAPNHSLAGRSHWDDAWDHSIRLRLPSRLLVGTANMLRLLSRHVRPGTSFLEIGCAPGKLLAWVASRARAECSGMDYSPVGIAVCKRLFAALNLPDRFHCEDLFTNTLKEQSFDIVFSNGVIEHFNNPEDAVLAHWKLLKRGGKALIVIPNYHGIYGLLQRFFDEDNLKLHNLLIMETGKLEKLIDPELVSDVKVYPFGRISPGMVSWDRRLSKPIAGIVFHLVNMIGLVQPMDIKYLCPNLVLEFVRKQ